MKALGIDAGTTTVCAAVVEDGVLLDSVTAPNNSALVTANQWEKAQDPNIIRDAALKAADELFEKHPDIAKIGVTGQMHGILYLDGEGAPLSPLYTWQDGRGNLPYDSCRSYAAYLGELTGYVVSSGYGSVTHFYNVKNGVAPENAAVFCAVHDYIAMSLCGNSSPVTDSTDGASFGLFDLKKNRFDSEAFAKAGMSPAILPKISDGSPIGFYKGSVPVYAAIGDNQASFMGASGGRRETMLINVGTGSQFSAYTEEYMECPGLDTRPFPGGGYLIVGASLCGGRAYALLERFFRESAKEITGRSPESCYDAMAEILSEGMPDNIPTVSPLFQGTRENPDLRGSITGLDIDNFTPRHLLWGMLNGMARELYDMYLGYKNAGGADYELTGSGNGLRKNKYLQERFEKLFGMPIKMSDCREEAACGAALYAIGKS